MFSFFCSKFFSTAISSIKKRGLVQFFTFSSFNYLEKKQKLFGTISFSYSFKEQLCNSWMLYVHSLFSHFASPFIPSSMFAKNKYKRRLNFIVTKHKEEFFFHKKHFKFYIFTNLITPVNKASCITWKVSYKHYSQLARCYFVCSESVFHVIFR